MTHAHLTAMAVTLILFIVGVFLHKSGGKEKVLKIVQMILRLFYLLVILTGAMMLFQTTFPFLYIIKALLGIVTIGMFEMVLTRSIKGKPTGMFWGILILSLVVTIFLGFHLPM